MRFQLVTSALGPVRRTVTAVHARGKSSLPVNQSFLVDIVSHESSSESPDFRSFHQRLQAGDSEAVQKLFDDYSQRLVTPPWYSVSANASPNSTNDRFEPPMSSPIRNITITATLFWFTIADPCVAQDVVVVDPTYRYPTRLRWAIYDPYFAVTSRVYAQADLIRAQGDAAVSYGLARNLHAEAYSKELDNWKKELRIYWERKSLAEQKKLELDHVQQIARMKYLNDRKWQNSRVWDRLKNHPELSETNIRTGKALNFLLARLAASSLPYQFDRKATRYSEQALQQLDLDHKLLSHFTLAQGPFKFTANQSVDSAISLWPYILRWDEFQPSRAAFEQARAVVVRESEETGQESVDSIRRMETALLQLTNEYHASPKVAQWVKQRNRYTHFYSGDRFLQELDREILQLEKSGDIRPLRGNRAYDPNVDGDNVVSLLCFMNRNGVEFAKPKPGSEFAYHNLFVMMRGLYLTVCDEDESLRPENLGELAK